MGMGRSNSSLTYSTSVRNFCIPSTSNTRFSSPPITRKTRKSRATYSFEKNTKPSIKKCCSTLKKKLIVFKYMGPESPSQFTRKEQNVVMRGLLAEISLEATESEIREEICAVIRSCGEHNLSDCTSEDFEFIDMSGKCASVPNCRRGFQFDGQGIKQLSGAGSLYVRLTRDLLKNEVQVIDVTSDSSDSSLPPFILPHSGRASSHLSSSQGPSTSASNQGLSSSQGPSTSAFNQGLSFSQGPSTSASNQGLSGPSTSASNQGLSFSQGPSTSDSNQGLSPVLLVIIPVNISLPVLVMSKLLATNF